MSGTTLNLLQEKEQDAVQEEAQEVVAVERKSEKREKCSFFASFGGKVDSFINRTSRRVKVAKYRLKKDGRVPAYIEDHGYSSVAIIGCVLGVLVTLAAVNFQSYHGVNSKAFAAEQPDRVQLGSRVPAGQQSQDAGQDMPVNYNGPTPNDSEPVDVLDPQSQAWLAELEKCEEVPALRNIDKEAVGLAKTYDSAKTAPKPYMEPNNGRINFYFGAMDPRIVCRPLRLTDIELEPNERLTDDGVNIADSARWSVNIGTSGDANYLITHIMVKPAQPNIATNMIVHTNRRTYTMELVSSADKQYMRYVGFIYNSDAYVGGEDTSAITAGKKASAQAVKAKYAAQDAAAAEKRKAQLRKEQHGFDMNRIYKNYKIKSAKGKVPSWMPSGVFDVGGKTYIKMNPSISVTEAPSVFVIRDSKEKLVNYRVYKNWYIIDSLFEKALMKIGGSKVIITRQNSIYEHPEKKKTADAAED